MCIPMSRCCVLHVVSMRVREGAGEEEDSAVGSGTGNERVLSTYFGRPSGASSCVGMESSR